MASVGSRCDEGVFGWRHWKLGMRIEAFVAIALLKQFVSHVLACLVKSVLSRICWIGVHILGVIVFGRL